MENRKSMAEILEDALKAKNYSKRGFADIMGWTPQNFGQRLKKNSFTAEELREMASKLGYDIVFMDPVSGDTFEGIHRGRGRRVKSVKNHVSYDTFNAYALCDNFNESGNIPFELYKDFQGRFFIAMYASWDGGKDTITPTTEEHALELYQKYGDGTFPFQSTLSPNRETQDGSIKS